MGCSCRAYFQLMAAAHEGFILKAHSKDTVQYESEALRGKIFDPITISIDLPTYLIVQAKKFQAN